MGSDDRREIFERLEALERMVRSRHGDGRSRDDRHRGDRDRRHRDRHDRDRDRDRGRDGGDDFQEKRIIDTIVSLVSEQVGRMMEDRESRSERRDDGGGEKRIVDLVVRLVSEHVQEIVATELDRRLGPPKDGSGKRSDEPEAADED